MSPTPLKGVREHRPERSDDGMRCGACGQELLSLKAGVWLIWISLESGQVCQELAAGDTAQRAEELHAEHHRGYIVPSLDSCPDHTRAEYEQLVSTATRQRIGHTDSVVCMDCGVFVMDTTAHTRFHSILSAHTQLDETTTATCENRQD